MTKRVCGSGVAFWTDARVARLKELAQDENMSARAIAKDLGGVTRNAVIGKLLRLGVKRKCAVQPRRRTSQIPHAQRNGGAVLSRIKARVEEKARSDRKAPAAPSEDFELPSSEATSLPIETAGNNTIALLDLRDHHCRYPIYVSGGVMFCGDGVSRGPYCERHAMICFSDKAT